MEVIVKTIFGAQLYGTNTPNSDTDYKTVFIPSLRDLLLKGPYDYIDNSTGEQHKKNTKNDIDDKWYSLMKFIDLAKKGDMMATDVLHTPASMTVESSVAWELLREYRDAFYQKGMVTFLEQAYVRKQVAKYGFKGSRLNSAQKMIGYLDNLPKSMKIREVFHMPGFREMVEKDESMSLEKAPVLKQDGTLEEVLTVVGKRFMGGEKCENVQRIMNRFVDSYGERAKLAATSEGVDWKAVSHALRACYQYQELFSEGDITLPLPRHVAQHVLAVKLGQMSWESVAPQLEDALEQAKELSNKSSIPDVINDSDIESITLEIYETAGYPIRG